VVPVGAVGLDNTVGDTIVGVQVRDFSQTTFDNGTPVEPTHVVGLSLGESGLSFVCGLLMAREHHPDGATEELLWHVLEEQGRTLAGIHRYTLRSA
jgi:hypothetical protein